jgi:hypothetical protein
LSTTRHPHNLKCKRSTSGALPLASTFRCEFVVGRTMTLSSCEPLAGAACQEAASGEPSCGRQNNKLMGSISSVPCFCDAESAMETRVRDPKTAKLTDLPHCLWVQKSTHGTGPAGTPSKKTRLSEGDSQKFRRAARADEKKRGISLEGGRFLDTPQKTVCPP